MTDEPQPAPVFPQYEPPVPVVQGIAQLPHPKQQKPLFKMINRMLRPRNKVVKKAGKRKKRGVA